MNIEATTEVAESGLTARLGALSRIVSLGEERLGPELLGDAKQLLERAGERMKLSADHTVVGLAGGTGSGKSSLFNAVCGLELSPVGLRRPTTSHTHACVWGLEGAGPLLDWLEIQWRFRFARASVLDREDSQLRGLILLDLPDHDSIKAMSDGEAERMIGVADLIVWVLDPQKYADASVHRRYLSSLAGHDAVTVFVLNQADRLAPEELAECVGDLRTLLGREGLAEPRIITTSAVTGRGLDGFKGVLAESVAARRAASARLGADLDRLTPPLSEMSAASAPASVDAARRTGLVDGLCDAAGVPALGEALENAYGVRAIDWIGWPYARWATLARRDPLRRMKLSGLREEMRALAGGTVSAQPAEVDNAVQALVDGVAGDLPPSWQASVREAARERAAELPEELGTALAEEAPSGVRIPMWWRALMDWQYLLVVLVGLGLVWTGAIVAYGVFKMGRPPVGVLGEVTVLPWLALAMLSALGLGLLTAIGCRNLVVLGASHERERLEARMRTRVADVAAELVIGPVEAELFRYSRFRDAVRALNTT